MVSLRKGISLSRQTPDLLDLSLLAGKKFCYQREPGNPADNVNKQRKYSLAKHKIYAVVYQAKRVG